MFYCKGTIGNLNPNWVSTNLTVVPSETGTTVSNDTQQARLYYTANKRGTSTTDFDYDVPLRIEYDYEHISADLHQLQIVNEDNQMFSSYLDTGHVVCDVTENGATLKIDGTTRYTSQINFSKVYIRFLVRQGGAFKYSNFKVYPI